MGCLSTGRRHRICRTSIKLCLHSLFPSIVIVVISEASGARIIGGRGRVEPRKTTMAVWDLRTKVEMGVEEGWWMTVFVVVVGGDMRVP